MGATAARGLGLCLVRVHGTSPLAAIGLQLLSAWCALSGWGCRCNYGVRLPVAVGSHGYGRNGAPVASAKRLAWCCSLACDMRQTAVSANLASFADRVGVGRRHCTTGFRLLSRKRPKSRNLSRLDGRPTRHTTSPLRPCLLLAAICCAIPSAATTADSMLLISWLVCAGLGCVGLVPALSMVRPPPVLFSRLYLGELSWNTLCVSGRVRALLCFPLSETMFCRFSSLFLCAE